jgi:hypothetical protein
MLRELGLIEQGKASTRERQEDDYRGERHPGETPLRASVTRFGCCAVAAYLTT